jgi:HD-like signal output (HDOD) protein
MVHDIGAFYMIYRASLYEELALRPETTRYLIVRWHESIGHTLVIALGLPVELADAIRDHDQSRAIPESPRTLADVVFLANQLAGGISGWLGHHPSQFPISGLDKIRALDQQLGEEIRAHEASLLAAFA